MTEVKDGMIHGCLKKQIMTGEMNELKDQTSDGTGIMGSQLHASDVQAVESTILNEATTPSVMPSEVHPSACYTCGKQSLVYALGTLGYDFGSEARRDSFVQSMEGDWPNPDDPAQLLTHLEKNPEYAESLIWTLDIESTPVYAIRPIGSFASTTYKRLSEFLKAQGTDGVERVSIPGVIAGKVKLFSGQTVPVIVPELRGMYSWTTNSLVNAVISQELKVTDEKTMRLYSERKEGLRNFMERIYYELMNLGQISSDRAMNFAGTNAFQAEVVFGKAASENMMLDSIETERSPVCRPDSDCWDVKLTFFDPKNTHEVARKVYRFTIDVSDVVPVSVGEVRSWSVY